MDVYIEDDYLRNEVRIFCESEKSTFQHENGITIMTDKTDCNYKRVPFLIFSRNFFKDFMIELLKDEKVSKLKPNINFINEGRLEALTESKNDLKDIIFEIIKNDKLK